MSAEKIRIQILKLSAQTTIRIATTAASSMAVIPVILLVRRVKSLVLRPLRERGD